MGIERFFKTVSTSFNIFSNGKETIKCKYFLIDFWIRKLCCTDYIRCWVILNSKRLISLLQARNSVNGHGGFTLRRSDAKGIDRFLWVSDGSEST